MNPIQAIIDALGVIDDFYERHITAFMLTYTAGCTAAAGYTAYVVFFQ